MKTLIEKRRVTMTAVTESVSVTGVKTTIKHELTDYVPTDKLGAYVAAARLNWKTVEVSAVHDAGPGGNTYTEE